MIDFATLQGLTIPEGVVTQITDAQGNVLWKLETNKPIVLEVEKITSDTYAGETTYENEQFIRIEVSVKTGGTASVTYGGVTRTFTVTEEDDTYNFGVVSRYAIFGTFNGVDYNAETPASGTLTIDGDYDGIGCSSFNSANKTTSYCTCVKNIVSLGNSQSIRGYGFYGNADIKNIPFPNTIKSIGMNAFYDCIGLVSIEFPNGLERIATGAFNGCTNLKSITFKNTTGWQYTTDTITDEESVWEDVDVSDPTANATRLIETHSAGTYRRVAS